MASELGKALGGDFAVDGGGGTVAEISQACLEVLERLLTVGLSDEALLVRQEVVGGLEVSQSDGAGGARESSVGAGVLSVWLVVCGHFL